MVVRIRYSRWDSAKRYYVALVAGSFLTPLALIAFSCALLGFAAEFRWTQFLNFRSFLFARWQTWLVMAAALLLVARLLGSYGNRGIGVREGETFAMSGGYWDA